MSIYVLIVRNEHNRKNNLQVDSQIHSMNDFAMNNKSLALNKIVVQENKLFTPYHCDSDLFSF